MNAEQLSQQTSLPPLRVRTGVGYALKYIILLEPRNARVFQRRFPPLHRLFRWGDAVALVPEPDCDLIHSFNAVPLLTRRPYLITFEDFMPRVPEDRHIPWLERHLQNQLCSPRCVAIVAMSEYARRQFLWQNRAFRGLSVLKDKLQVIYPAVALRRTQPKTLTDELRLIFVGNVHMRKGLPALLKAHRQLKARGVPVSTTIISGLKWDPQDYVGPPDRSYVEAQQRLLDQEGVSYHPFSPFDEVMRLMDEAHFLVFPTFHDTFGFVSLDALSCATPVLVTATCAQPEVIEEDRCGYLLPFENDASVGKWAWLYRNHDPGYLEAYDQTIDRLSAEIIRRLMLCWERRKDYERLSAGALQRVRDRFSPPEARDRVEALYERCRRTP